MTPGSADSHSAAEEALRPLREAVKISPDNAPLRQHLAESLLNYARFEEAEKEFRQALALTPDNAKLTLGLARAFQGQNKISHAVAALDELTSRPGAPGEAYVLHARLLFQEGEVERSVRQYKRGVEIDPQAEDLQFASTLGISANEADDEDYDDGYGEVVEGRVRESWEGEAEEADAEIERPKIDFEAVGGGILMYGPPSCGKTHLARATAGEINVNFISIGINDVLDMWIGNSERNLHELLEQARRNRP